MDMNSGAVAELYAHVGNAAADTPYVVTRTDQGFDLAVDLSTPRWCEVIYGYNLQQVFVHRVAVDAARKKLTIKDQLYSLQWRGDPVSGSPVAYLGAQISKQSGRVVHKSSFRTIGATGEGSDPNAYNFSSEEGRRLIIEPAKRLGWGLAMSLEVKIGIIGAIVGVLVALVGVTAAVLAMHAGG